MQETQKIIVIKIWTNALMDKKWWLNIKLIKDLAKQIDHLKNKLWYNIVLVSSWAVWMWKQKISLKKNIWKIQAKQFFASIWQPFLMQEYQTIFDQYNIIVAQALLTRSDFAIREKYISMRDILSHLLENWVIPIINENDVLSPEELDFSDNDQLSAYVAWMLWADRLIILSDVNWLYTKHPSEKGAKKIDIVTNIDEKILSYVDHKKSSWWTGWMGSKISTAKLIMSLWISMNIASSEEKNVLLNIINWKNIWTMFKPVHKKNITGIRRWLSTGAYPKGKIFVSTIISDLLKNQKRSSILATWVEKLKWEFEKWDVIEVKNEKNESLWYWISKIWSDELQKIIKQNKENVKDIIIIHTDYFLSI